MGTGDATKKLHVLQGGSSRQDGEEMDSQEFASLLELYDNSFRNIAEGEVVKGRGALYHHKGRGHPIRVSVNQLGRHGKRVANHVGIDPQQVVPRPHVDRSEHDVSRARHAAPWRARRWRRDS